jgi:glucosylceramidase
MFGVRTAHCQNGITIFLSLLVIAAVAESEPLGTGTISVVQSSEGGDQWKSLPPLTWGGEFKSAVDITVMLNATRQKIMGFGAAMTDTSAYNAMVWMNNKSRDEYFEALWGKTGLGSSLGRVTLNSADYSYESFNYDNSRDDFDLVHFDHTLAYDHQRVIPMIKRAMTTANAAWKDPIRLFASPWSPPGWIKTNGNMINSKAVCLRNDTAAGSYKQVPSPPLLSTPLPSLPLTPIISRILADLG